MTQSIDQVRQEVWSHLHETQCVYFATVEGDQPRVRPVTLLDLEEKFWIATDTRSAKARQIRRNPNVEFCLPLRDESGEGYLRVGGVATIVTDPLTLERIGSRIPFLVEYWKGMNDPDFCLIRITRVEVEYLQPGGSEATTFII